MIAVGDYVVHILDGVRARATHVQCGYLGAVMSVSIAFEDGGHGVIGDWGQPTCEWRLDTWNAVRRRAEADGWVWRETSPDTDVSA